MIRKILFTPIAVILVFSYCGEVKIENQKEKTALEKITLLEDYTFSTIVSKNGKIILEEYYNGKTKDSLCDVQSLSKGLMSVLVGIAIDKGYINNEDEPIEKHFLESFENLSDKKKKHITIKHLLNQTSGLAWKGYLEHEEWLNSKDPISYVLNKDLEHEPGKVYNYNSGATHLLSIIINRATGLTTLEFANKFLFNDLQIISVDWQKRNKGYFDGSGLGLKMKPIDLMKIGQLLAENGNWAGKQLVSREWVQKLFYENEKYSTEWGLRNSKHGFCWYQSVFNGNKINYGMGYGGQFIIMIPDKELIIIATHNHDTPDGTEQQIQFLERELPKLIEKHGK